MRKLWTSLLLCASALCAADKVYAPYFELVNVHPDYQFASAKLLKSYVDGEGKYQLELPPRADSLVHQGSSSEVRAQAQAQGCPFYLMGDLTRLGEGVIVSFSLYNTADGKMLWSDRLKAQNPDDLDPILQKVARQLGSAQASKDGNIYSVTRQESTQLRQKQANSSFGATIGGTYVPSHPYSTFLGGVGVNWLYDNRNLLVQIDATYQGAEDKDKSLDLFGVGIGAYYPFFDEDWTPFIGGAISYTVGEYDDDEEDYSSNDYENGYSSYDYEEDHSQGGLLFRAGGGLLFSRTSTVNLRLRTEYQMSTFKIDGHPVHGLWVGVDAGFSR